MKVLLTGDSLITRTLGDSGYERFLMMERLWSV